MDNSKRLHLFLSGTLNTVFSSFNEGTPARNNWNKKQIKISFFISICDHELISIKYSTTISVNLFLLSYCSYLLTQPFLPSVLMGPQSDNQGALLATQVVTTLSPGNLDLKEGNWWDQKPCKSCTLRSPPTVPHHPDLLCWSNSYPSWGWNAQFFLLSCGDTTSAPSNKLSHVLLSQRRFLLLKPRILI